MTFNLVLKDFISSNLQKIRIIYPKLLLFPFSYFGGNNWRRCWRGSLNYHGYLCSSSHKKKKNTKQWSWGGISHVDYHYLSFPFYTGTCSTCRKHLVSFSRVCSSPNIPTTPRVPTSSRITTTLSWNRGSATVPTSRSVISMASKYVVAVHLSL